MIVEEFLNRSMEATCHNLDQHNPDQPVNSTFEFMEISIRRLRSLLLGNTNAEVELDYFAGLVQDAITSNMLEGGENLAISGAACDLVTELRRIEANGTDQIQRKVGAKKIAHRLRGPLNIHLDPAGSTIREIAEARHTVREYLNHVPADQLLAPGVKKQLGPRKYALLERMLEDRAPA